MLKIKRKNYHSSKTSLMSRTSKITLYMAFEPLWELASVHIFGLHPTACDPHLAPQTHHHSIWYRQSAQASLLRNKSPLWAYI